MSIQERLLHQPNPDHRLEVMTGRRSQTFPDGDPRPSVSERTLEKNSDWVKSVDRDGNNSIAGEV